jgi:hypothetical protein
MQVVNANKAVTSLEVSTDGGNTWQGTTRQVYNFFENSSGFGTTMVDVRVTSTDGDVVVVKNVGVGGGESVTATSNFGDATAAATSSAAAAATSSTAPVAAPSNPTTTDLSEDDTCEA